jgi:small-conductance mechanosensitive channel
MILLLTLTPAGLLSAPPMQPQVRDRTESSGSTGKGSDIERFVQILKDDQKRQQLISRLERSEKGSANQAAQESESDTTLSESLWENVSQVGQETVEAIERTVTSVPALLTLAQRLVLSLLLLGAGYAVWRLVKRYLLPHVLSRWPVKVLSVVVLGLGLALGLLSVWGLEVAALVTRPPGRAILRSLLTIVFVVIGAYAVWEFINHVLNRYVARMSLGEELGRRLQTVVPLARSAMLMVICVITALVVLSELGINIAPLLAGAGIAGLAIGFGAQTLVKDLLTGFFVLLENTINVGDWVILGGHDGQVEGLSIRHVTVRDIYGNLHTVPWSSVVSITNQTRNFGYAVVEVGFAYRENIDEVVAVVKQVAEEMRQDPAISHGILSELQVLGLIELGDSAVVVRTRFKTAPFMRWRLERDFRRRIKNRFDELGIEIPFPHQTVYFGQNKQGQAVPARVHIDKAASSETSGA